MFSYGELQDGGHFSWTTTSIDSGNYNSFEPKIIVTNESKEAPGEGIYIAYLIDEEVKFVNTESYFGGGVITTLTNFLHQMPLLMLN